MFQRSIYAKKDDKSYLQTASKGQFLFSRNKGETQIRALRLCNFSEWYNKSQNSCQPCRSQNTGSVAFPLEINAGECTECSDYYEGKLSSASAEQLDRFKYLCDNRESFPRMNSSKSSQSFFDFGVEIPSKSLNYTLESTIFWVDTFEFKNVTIDV